MSSDRFSEFAISISNHLLDHDAAFKPDSKRGEVVHVTSKAGKVFHLDMTPFDAVPREPTAFAFFDGVNSIHTLLSAYESAKSSIPFETDIPDARANLSDYVEVFMRELFEKARTNLNDEQATLIGNWVKNLDVYCAVKSVESFMYSHADLKLLEIAPKYDWDVVFDHMAIRCGSQAHQDAERVATLLREEHGYASTQFKGEDYYQFPDGWNAYPVYKMLKNGQVLRVFVDQSDGDDDKQIIQHWNRVYGYTAHHVGIRATKVRSGMRVAVPLEEVMLALEKEGIEILTPTGQYTEGLLLQVFTKPEVNTAIPQELKDEITAHGKQLEKVIENAKLLELVSRRELNPSQAFQFFALYGLQYDVRNPLHSAPIYQYFLPAQAAHVIKTSQQVA